MNIVFEKDVSLIKNAKPDAMEMIVFENPANAEGISGKLSLALHSFDVNLKHDFLLKCNRKKVKVTISIMLDEYPNLRDLLISKEITQGLYNAVDKGLAGKRTHIDKANLDEVFANLKVEDLNKIKSVQFKHKLEYVNLLTKYGLMD